jgi:hypothetical protein
LGKIKKMSEEADMEKVVETTPVEEPEAVVEDAVEAVVVEESVEPAVVQKKKRKRSEAQVNALAAARKSKMSKMSSKKKPVKIERQYAESPNEEFSWAKEICKASILASLGLASIYVQQKCAQTVPPPDVVQVEEKTKKKSTVKTGGKDPFAGYR